jgi:dihydrofolate reductase
MLSHIVAASENNVIGRQNKLPWHLPNDFRYFKNKTWGMPVIMGRKSFEALHEPLPGRMNIVITANTGWKPQGAIIVHSIAEAIEKAEETDANEIFIIGGGEIFRQTMDIVSRIHLTRVHTTLDGDTYYPELDPSQWQLEESQSFAEDDKNEFGYTFEVWERKDKH